MKEIDVKADVRHAFATAMWVVIIIVVCNKIPLQVVQGEQAKEVLVGKVLVHAEHHGHHGGGGGCAATEAVSPQNPIQGILHLDVVGAMMTIIIIIIMIMIVIAGAIPSGVAKTKVEA